MTQLTDHRATDSNPNWSPVIDPTPIAAGRIAFGSDRDGNEEIYLMNADGSGLIRLTDDPGRDGNPSWSPDGERIAFHSNRDGNWNVYVMNADGSGVTRLTDNSAGGSSPSWSPDGGRIAFESDRDGGNWETYVMNADGSGVTPAHRQPRDRLVPQLVTGRRAHRL